MLASFSRLRIAFFLLFTCWVQSAFAQLQELDITPSNSNTANFTDVWMVDGSTGYAAGRLAIYKTTNGGATWNLLPAFDPTSGPFGIGDFDFYIQEQHLYFTDANHGISAAWNHWRAAEEIIVTNDGGATWTVKHMVNPDNAPFQSFEPRLRFLDRLSSGTFITGGYRGRILLSTDGGNTWTVSTTNTVAHLEDMSFIDASTGFAAGQKVLLKTTNGGSTWTKTDTDYFISNIKAFSATSLLATTEAGIIIRSTDGGQTWVELIDTDDIFTDIEFLDNQLGFVVGENSLYKTTNGGASFQFVQIMPSNHRVTEMQALAEKKFYLATNVGKILFNNNTDLAFENANGFYSNTKSICQNSSVVFHNFGNPGYSYKWYVNGAEVAQTYDLNYSFANTSFHSVKLVANGGAQPRTIEKYFEITAQPTKPPVATIYSIIPDTVEISVMSVGPLSFAPKIQGNYYQLFRNGVTQSDREKYVGFPDPYLPVHTLTVAGEYNYVLRSEAVNTCGIETTDTPFKIIAIDIPRRLTELKIHHAPNSQVELTWPQTSMIATHYNVERKMEGTSIWSVIATVPYDPSMEDMTFVDATVTKLKTYYYRVSVANANGQSKYSPVRKVNVYDKVIYVNKAAVGLNNGLTWTDAFKKIEDAAANSEADLEIWVAKGTYNPPPPVLFQTDASWIIAGKGMYGGFSGGETSRSQRITPIDELDQRATWITRTILEGQNVQLLLEIKANSALDGFTVRSASTAIHTYGLVVNCLIENSGNAAAAWEGAEVANCIVRNNGVGVTRWGVINIFNSIFYNNATPVTTYYMGEDGFWTPPSGLFALPDVYYSLIGNNPAHYGSVVISNGQNNIANDINNDPAIDGPGRPQREGRLLTYMAGGDGVWGNEDDIFYWPDAGFIDKGVITDPQVYANSKGFSKDLIGNDRVFNGIPDVGPIEYKPDLFLLPPSPIVVPHSVEDWVQVQVHGGLSDPSVTNVWLIAKDANGNDAMMWSLGTEDQTRLVQQNFGTVYSFEVRYERNGIVSRPSPPAQYVPPKKPGTFFLYDINVAMQVDKFPLLFKTADGRDVLYEIADPTIAEYVNTGEYATSGLTLKKTGTTTITARTLENARYLAYSVTYSLTITKGNQNIPPNLGGNIAADAQTSTKTYPATTLQGLTLTYSSNNTNVATVSGSVITFHASGNATISVSQAGDERYNPAASTFDLNVTFSKSNQILSGLTDVIKGIGDADFTPNVTTNSGLALSFTSSDPTTASVSGNSIHIVKVGEVTITVSQGGNNVWNPVSGAFKVKILAEPPPPKQDQILTYPTTITKGLTDAPFALPVATSSNLPLTFISIDPTVASVSGGTVTIHKIGTTTILFSQEGNASYNPAAGHLTISIVTNPPVKQDQVLTHPIGIEKSLVASPFAVPVTTSSNLPLTFSSSDPAVASVSGNTITIHKAGFTIISIFQPGNDSYNPVSGQFSISVVEYSHELIMITPTTYDYRFGMNAFYLAHATTKGMPVNYTSSDPSVLAIENALVTVKSAGTVTITAVAPVTEFYPQLTASVGLTINKASEEIMFNFIEDQNVGTSVVLTAHTAKQNAVPAFTLSSAKGSLSGNILNLLAPGQLSVTASYGATQNYSAPASVTRTVCIRPAPPTITMEGTNLVSSANENRWYRHGTLIAGATGKTLTLTQEGVYTARAVVETCVGDPSANFVVEVTAVKDPAPSAINLYPNPATHTLYVEGLSPGDCLRVLDVLGKQVYANTANATTVEVNVSDFAQGFYYVVVDGKKVVLRFLR